MWLRHMSINVPGWGKKCPIMWPFSTQCCRGKSIGARRGLYMFRVAEGMMKIEPSISSVKMTCRHPR